MLRVLARLIAVVCAIAFVVCAIPILFLHAAGTQLTQPQVYKDALARERIYDRLPTLMADTVRQAVDAGARSGAADESLANLVRQASPTDWERIFGALLPPRYLRSQTEGALDQAFDWLHSSAAVPVVEISLEELRQRLVAPEAEETFVRILQTKPPCTAAELQSGGGLSLGCCPPPEAMPQVRENFRVAMQKAAEQMPEKVNLCEKLGGGNATAEATRRLADMRTRIGQLEWLTCWSPAVLVAWLLLIAVFAVRSFRGWMFWWGIPCLVVGAASAVFALPAVPAGKWIFAHAFLPSMPAQVPAATLDALAGLVMAVLQTVMAAALHTAGAFAIGGLVAIILGVIFKSRPKPVAAPAS